MLEAQQVLQERYRLQQQLGQTAGRQTWLAEDLSTPAQQVIVKLLGFIEQTNWETLKLFEREANILRQLNHPRLPKYRDYFSIDDRVLWFGLVQDYIPGVSLKELLTQGKRFTESTIYKIAGEILQILIHLHELSPPVLHRDIKPSNLIWGDDRHVYLIDFGAVQDRAAVEGATFTVVGTYGYAPIEQFGGRTVPSSDLYSLRATLVHLLTGTAPADLPQRNLRIQFAHLVSINPNLVQWIEKLIEPDIHQRFSTARQALEALEALKNQPSVQTGRIHQTKQHEAIVSRRSDFSNVELNVTSDELQIRCPGNPAGIWQSRIGMVMLISAIIFSSSLEFITVPLLFFGVVTIWGGIDISAATRVIVGRRYLTCHKEFHFLNQTSTLYERKLAQIDIASIQDVFHHEMQFREGKSATVHRVITVQTRDDDYSFGKGLCRQDCVWLTQEIQKWLKFHP